ncbi:Response regulator PleD [Rubripirellula amarantea]|uniref:diguanylate cyclase n=1 Tax=Rubripirellula amarantea TaxID=2527999 RepID=A0A5C5WUH6_9BACT|nr:diguanylate cyclase [Rubripirellula amarantea]TWT54258.1 Response regulator PleD [Rubripirellula amarantea]
MSQTVQSTVNYQHDSGMDTEALSRFLVQIHPLDIDRGPLRLDDLVTLGRSSGCTIHIEDDSVSRQHAQIERGVDGFQITDLDSTNGVQVNNEFCNEKVLQSGDRIQLGSRVFRFLSDNDFESQYHETVYAMMTRDGLTGTYNKRYLVECLGREVSRCKRFDRPIAIAILDIDHFKAVNDTYGHLVGDEVLKELAIRLSGVLRNDEVLARFGGEEFCVVMPEADAAQGFKIAERCRLAICNTPFSTRAGKLDITASFGVASPDPTTLTNPEMLMSEADQRLYEAKRVGRNCVVATPVGVRS